MGNFSKLSGNSNRKLKKIISSRAKTIARKTIKNQVDLRIFFINSDYKPMPSSLDAVWESLIKAFKKAKKREKLNANLKELSTQLQIQKKENLHQKQNVKKKSNGTG